MLSFFPPEIGGGFVFGLWWGFLIVWVGHVAGAALSFLF
jgi:uncharacterized membrane protein YdjX (TVP38/TMEM64 family)